MNPPSELLKRVATGLVGAILLVLLITHGGWIGIRLLAAGLTMGMVYEFATLSFTGEDRSEKKYLMLLTAWVLILINFFTPRADYEWVIAVFMIFFTYSLFSVRGREGEALSLHFRELEISFFGMVYLVFIPLYLVRIREGANGLHWTLIFFLVVWAGDTLAYFVGKKFGKKKLYPAISPKKTVEGGLGGLLAGVVIALAYKLLFFKAMPWAAVLLFPVLVGIVAQIGDLCESFLKRAHGTKDSGSLLPGHGGFLDRFDGVVFSLPIMYACTRLFS